MTRPKITTSTIHHVLFGPSDPVSSTAFTPAGAGGGYIAEDDEIPPEVAAIVGPRPAFRLLLPTPQLNALIEEALEAVTTRRGGELHMLE